MVYQLTDLRTSVRSILQNISSTTLSDPRLDVILAQGKRTLDRDSPQVANFTIPGTGKKFYALTGVVTGWINQFSVIKLIQNPKAVVANDDQIIYTDPKYIKITEQDAIEYLRIEDGISSGRSALLRYTTPWKVSGLLGETTTTIPTKFINALEFIGVSLACASLSVKSAGQLDDQIDGDLINWEGKQASYKFVAMDYEAKYLLELGLEKGKVKPAMLRMDYDRDVRRVGYLTHFNQ